MSDMDPQRQAELAALAMRTVDQGIAMKNSVLDLLLRHQREAPEVIGILLAEVESLEIV